MHRSGLARRLAVAALALLFLRAAGPAAAADAPAEVVVCHGYGCLYRTQVHFDARDMARLRSIVVAGRASATAERNALGKAVQWFEVTVGPLAGTSHDKAKGDVLLVPDPGQEDCIDESTNTTTLLKLIESRGWLAYHRVGATKERGFLLDGRYPHNTATVYDKATGKRWAIDSWTHANGVFPDIMPIEVWVKQGVWGRSS
jgi:hypothetical protein